MFQFTKRLQLLGDLRPYWGLPSFRPPAPAPLPHRANAPLRRIMFILIHHTGSIINIEKS